jgi:hypothetical protein
VPTRCFGATNPFAASVRTAFPQRCSTDAQFENKLVFGGEQCFRGIIPGDDPAGEDQRGAIAHSRSVATQPHGQRRRNSCGQSSDGRAAHYDRLS